MCAALPGEGDTGREDLPQGQETDDCCGEEAVYSCAWLDSEVLSCLLGKLGLLGLGRK